MAVALCVFAPGEWGGGVIGGAEKDHLYGYEHESVFMHVYA